MANLSFGLSNTKKEVITLITPIMEKLRLRGTILVIAAGNGGIDTDIDANKSSDLFTYFINFEFVHENRPYKMDNIVAVAAVDLTGKLAHFSNFGKETVMLAAPGVGIHSCTSIPNNFECRDGTSFSAPQVSATLAMLMDIFPSDSYLQIIERLRQSVDRDGALESTTISGGCLNIGTSLRRSP